MIDATVLDEQARELIVRGGLDEGLFVEAGAGTGKTTQLVGRVVALVVDRGIPLREIAAITFTEAAASELRDRIREELERRAVIDPDPEIRERCAVALADADVAAIGTLHSFAQRLLGEHPVEVGIPPRVEVLDEVRSQLEFGARWSRFVDELFADPAYVPILTRAAVIGVKVESRGPSLRDVAVIFGESWDRLDRVAAEVDPTPIALDRAPLLAAVRAVQDLPTQCLDPDDSLVARIAEHAPEIARVAHVLEIGDDDDVLRVLRAKQIAKRNWRNMSRGKGVNWPDVAAARTVVKNADDECDVLLARASNSVLQVLAGTVAQFTLQAADERRQEGRLEFHDLLVLARRLLRESASARAALRQRYTRLLLDEFQDTDPIQIELAVLVASVAPAAGTPEADLVDTLWPLVDTEPERLFFVGDPKQSIYRFRRADIRLFLSARDRFAGPGAIALTRNFRTVAPVLDWVNHVFASVMQATEEHTQPGYTPLIAVREPSPADHRVVLLGEPIDPTVKINAARLRELEAEDVAQAVATILRRPDEWPVYDRALECWRAPRASEIAILVPTRTSLGGLQAALDDRAVPYRLEAGSLVYETQEVRDVLATIRAIVDPTNSLALVATLRSAVFGCADTELFEYRNAGGRWDVRLAPPETLPPEHPVVESMRALRVLWEQRWWISPSELVERLIRERRLFELAFAHKRPRDVWRRLRFVLDQARLFCESQGGDLVEFLAWSELQRRDTSRVHEPLLPETDDDSVRIMTIHAAKGLEFPITIVSGTTTKQQPRRGGVGVHWSEDDEVEVRVSSKVETERFNQLRDLEDEMDSHEKQRLLYVATTRARDHLIVAARHKPGDKCFANTLWTHSEPELGVLCRRFEPPPDADVPLPAPTPMVEADASDTPEARAVWIEQRSNLLTAQRASRSVSATTIARAVEPDPAPELGADLAAEDAVREELLGEEAAIEEDAIGDLESDAAGTGSDAGGGSVSAGAPVRRWRRGRAGTAFGRAVHEVLQLIDLGSGVGVEALAAAQCALEDVPDAVDAVVAHVRAALASEIVRTAAGGSSWREAYVATTVGNRVVEGYIDLLVRTPEGLVVVDYKTDGVRSPAEAAARVEHYRLQGATYALVLEASTGLDVVGVRFLFTGARDNSGAAIELPIVDLRAAIEEVQTRLSVLSA